MKTVLGNIYLILKYISRIDNIEINLSLDPNRGIVSSSPIFNGTWARPSAKEVRATYFSAVVTIH